MTTRRYGDDEVREIFSLATTGDTPNTSLPVESSGLTLNELQHIGREAGIEPDRVAQAAATLNARGKQTTVRRAFGRPIGATRVVDLPRAPTDREWEQLISEFRTTFGAPGVATQSGGMREWSHDDVHISVEPTERGEQLRISTLDNLALILNAAGSMMGGMALLMGGVVAAAGRPEKALLVFGIFGGMSLAALGANLVRLPGWARKREKQIQAIAEHAVKRLSNT